MYCSSCGKNVNQGLRFCNHCGATVGGAIEHDSSKLSESSLNLLLGGILGLPIAGLGIIIGLLSVMKKELGFGSELIIAFALMSFVLLLAAEGVFIWLLIHRARAFRETRNNARVNEGVIKSLSTAPVLELSEPPSITENTTRSFEPSEREPKRR
jgi:hypothetical protein